jgi:putative inorganic carbon (HCO3(-)) transporter
MAAPAPSPPRSATPGGAVAGLDTRPWLWQIGLAILTVVFGLVAGVQPRLAILAALAGVLGAVMVANLVFGLCVFTVISFLDVLPQLTGGFPVTKGVGLLLVGSWLLRTISERNVRDDGGGLLAQRPALAAALMLFLTWTVFSMLWAERSSSAADSLVRFALNFALFPIVFTALRTRRQIEALFGSFVLGALIAAAWGIATGTATAGRLAGAGLNPNQLGVPLAVGIVLAAALSANRAWPAIVRLAALVAAAGCMAGMFSTVSRQAALGLGVALLATPFVAGRGRRLAALGLVALAFGGSVVWLGLIAPHSTVERITHGDKYGGNGREDLWRVGWRMVHAHPVQGVGAGNFPVSSVHYLLRPGRTTQDSLIVDQPKVPHNIYLNVLAELGVVGIALFGVILASCLWSALAAARAFARLGDVTTEILARGLFLALVCFLVADFFSSQLFSKQLWLLLAAGSALRGVAVRRSGPPLGRVFRL